MLYSPRPHYKEPAKKPKGITHTSGKTKPTQGKKTTAALPEKTRITGKRGGKKSDLHLRTVPGVYVFRGGLKRHSQRGGPWKLQAENSMTDTKIEDERQSKGLETKKRKTRSFDSGTKIPKKVRIDNFLLGRKGGP